MPRDLDEGEWSPEESERFVDDSAGERPPDPREAEARSTLRSFFAAHREDVFFSRQIEVRHEQDYFHWVTNRALRRLRDEGLLLGESRPLKSGGTINLLWHKSYRFYRRSAARVVKLAILYK